MISIAKAADDDEPLDRFFVPGGRPSITSGRIVVHRGPVSKPERVAVSGKRVRELGPLDFFRVVDDSGCLGAVVRLYGVDSSAIVAAKTEEGLTGRTVHPVDGQVRLSRAGRRRLDRRSVAVGQRVPDLVHLRIVHVPEATSHLKQPRQQNPPSTSAL